MSVPIGTRLKNFGGVADAVAGQSVDAGVPGTKVRATVAKGVVEASLNCGLQTLVLVEAVVAAAVLVIAAELVVCRRQDVRSQGQRGRSIDCCISHGARTGLTERRQDTVAKSPVVAASNTRLFIKPDTVKAT